MEQSKFLTKHREQVRKWASSVVCRQRNIDAVGVRSKSKAVIIGVLAAATIGLSGCQAIQPAIPPASPTPQITSPTPSTQQPPPQTSQPESTLKTQATPAKTEQKTAVLDAVERDKLSNALKLLSKSWDQPSVEAANSIMFKEYASDVWMNFFDEFFSSHPLTDDLKNYLGYQVFHWAPRNSQDNLQSALTKSLMKYASDFMEKNFPSLPEMIEKNPVTRQTLMNTHRFLNELAGGSSYESRESRLTNGLKNEVFQFYLGYVKKYPQYFKAEFDTKNRPYLGAIKAQVQMNLRDAVNQTQDSKSQISDVLGLSGKRLDMWNNYSVLIIDNYSLDDRQLSVIDNMLRFIPKSLHDLGVITVNDFLGNTGDKYLPFKNRYAINIFGLRVGDAKENSFPSDVSPSLADIYSLVVAHEVNHIVDAYLSQNPVFAERKKQLITQAGDTSQNYLRSMFENGFFTKNPQEFFASISNEWFTDSEKTIELALSRFDKGISQPFNQALFFADAYSQGDVSYLYRLDALGNLSRSEAKLGRDGAGRINSLAYMDKSYSFKLDASGNVIGHN